MMTIESLEQVSRLLEKDRRLATVRAVLLEKLGGTRTHEVLYALAQGNRYGAAEELRQRIEERKAGLPSGWVASLVMENRERFSSSNILRAASILVMEKLVAILDPPKVRKC